MDRQALIADLRLAAENCGDAANGIHDMIEELKRGRDMPRASRSYAAEKLNRAAEYVRRSYDG